jgi:hypothetical protein
MLVLGMLIGVVASGVVGLAAYVLGWEAGYEQGWTNEKHWREANWGRHEPGLTAGVAPTVSVPYAGI